MKSTCMARGGDKDTTASQHIDHKMKKGREVLSKSKPDMSKQEYLTLMESQLKEEEYES